MTGISEETWARLRAQVEACQGESIPAAEERLRREFREAVTATGWDGRTCRVDPSKVTQANAPPILHFWLDLVRDEYRLTGRAFLKAERRLGWAFYLGHAPWDREVIAILSWACDGYVWSRRARRRVEA